MHKIIISLLLIGLYLPVFAQYQGPQPHLQKMASQNYLSRIGNTLRRVLFQKQPVDNPWFTAIKRTSTNAHIPHGYLGIQTVFYPEPVLQTRGLTSDQEQIYQLRSRQIQHILKQHKYYSYYNYTLVMPRKQDLIQLPENELQMVLSFFRQPEDASKTSSVFNQILVENHKYHIVKVSLPDNIFIFFDCFRKRVYIVYKDLNIPNLPLATTKPGEDFCNKKS